MKKSHPCLRNSALALMTACWLTATCTLAAADSYLSPQGTGTKDGTSRENAASATGDGLQQAWDKLEGGGTLWLLPGDYNGASLNIHPGKTRDVRTLSGLSEGEKRATFVGDFDKLRPEKTGGHVITITREASDWVLKDLDFRNVNTAVHLLGGNSQGKLQGLRVYGAREGIRSEGKGKASVGSQNITVSDCVFEHFTKRGLRLLAGHKDIVIERCSADAGGKDWATEPFQMGFALEADCDEISFTDCVARNSYNDGGKKYWNGDGFCVEEAGTVRWTRCRAFDNTDGGWDSKAKLSVLVDCIALRNKRNIRIWGKATLENCLAAYAQYPRSTDGASIWSKGEVQLTACTLVGSRPVECEDGGKSALEKCYIVTLPKADGEREAFPAEGTSVTGSEVLQGDLAGLPKLFVSPDKSSEDGAGFNRSGKDGAVGYKHRGWPKK